MQKSGTKFSRPSLVDIPSLITVVSDMAASSSPTQVFFSYAFRPFFLFISVYAVLAIGGWALHQWGLWGWPDSMPAHVRHGHEMLFGYAGGAIAGFLLTAVATWTSRPAVSAAPLMGLCIVWMAARIAAFIPTPAGFAVWGVASLLFWATLAGLMAREVVAARNIRNYATTRYFRCWRHSWARRLRFFPRLRRTWSAWRCACVPVCFWSTA